MQKNSPLRTYAGMAQSTIVKSPSAPKGSFPTFDDDFGNFIGERRNSGFKYSYQEDHQITDSSEYTVSSDRIVNRKFTRKIQSYTNQNLKDFTEDGTGNGYLIKSTIVDQTHLSNFDNRMEQAKTSRERFFGSNTYASSNLSTPRNENFANEQQPQDNSDRKQGLSPSSNAYNKKSTQNTSIQFSSPRKNKKPSIAIDQKVEMLPKNDLQSYKKLQVPSPTRKKPIPSSHLQFSLNTVPVDQTPNLQSRIKRQFSVGKFGMELLLEPIDQVKQKTSITHEPSPVPTRSSFINIKQLGKGKYGDVFLTQYKHNRIICALKVIPKQVIKSEEMGINQFIRQVTIQMYLKSPYVVELWGIFSDEENVYLIMEPALEGQLHKYMNQRKQLDEAETASLIKQIAKGVQYLQSENIIHRDLKPQNILLHEGSLKICDFGWAVHNEDSFRVTFCGTPLYLSPDVLKGDQYNDKVDNWAIGIITYQMLVGRIPFRITQQSQMQKIITQQIKFPEYIMISQVCKHFILSLLDRNPDTRLNIEEILNHPFLALASVKN